MLPYQVMMNNRLKTKNMKQELYSEIEDLIITWNSDGTKTAGALTREIILVIDKTNEENNKKEKYFQQFHPPVNRR